MLKPTVYVVLEGGLVQETYGTVLVEVIVLHVDEADTHDDETLA